MHLFDLIGLKIVAAKGYANKDKRVKIIELVYILFDDNETYIEFEEQDSYTYRDCSRDARLMCVRKNAKQWSTIMENYPDANDDFTF